MKSLPGGLGGTAQIGAGQVSATLAQYDASDELERGWRNEDGTPNLFVQARTFVVTFETIGAPGTLSTGNVITPVFGNLVVWTVEWGVGGTTHTRVVSNQRGRMTVHGTTCRVTASLAQNVAGFPPAAAGVVANVKASISPLQSGAPSMLGESIWQHQRGASGTFNIPTSQVNGVPCRLMSIQGYNFGASLRYLMLFDDVTKPPNGTEPQKPLIVPAGQNFSMDFGVRGADFGQGLTWGASSTPDTFTTDVAATFQVDAEFVP